VQNKEIDARIGKANTALSELQHCTATKQELSNTAELSLFKSVFVPFHLLPCLANGRKSTVYVQAEEMGILRTSNVRTIGGKKCGCELCKVVNVEPLLGIERFQLVVRPRD